MARSAAIVAAGTLTSRVTGLGRILAMAYALGISESRLADVFNVANTLPNILFELVLGGVLSSVFIPLVVDALRREGGEREVGVLMGTALAVLAAVSVLLSLAAPLVVRVFTFRGGATAAEQTSLSAFLFRFFAFQVLFYGMTGIYGGLLNARGRFGVPAFAPAANNVVAILVFLAFALVADGVDVAVALPGRLLLGLGTTAAVAAMAVIQLGPARRALPGLRLRVSFSGVLVRRLVSLSGWAFLYVAAWQFETGITLALAYGTQGGAAAYAVGLAFSQLPHGVLAASIMTATLPRLADRAAAGDMDGYRARLETAISGTIAVMLPVAVAYILVAHPAMRVLLQRGNVTTFSAAYVATIVQIFTIGVPFFSLWLLFLRGFYALQDARTPAQVTLVASATFVVLDFMLYPLLAVEGLAWVHTIGYGVGMVLAGVALTRRVGDLDWRRLGDGMARVAAATFVMALVLWPLAARLTDAGAGLWRDLLAVAVSLIAGGLAFVAAALLLDIREILDLPRLMARPAGAAGTGPAPRPAPGPDFPSGAGTQPLG